MLRPCGSAARAQCPRLAVHPAHGAPTHVPLMQTAQGGRLPFPHGSQQSGVCEQPDAKNGTQFAASHTPVTSGNGCTHVNPAAHTGGGPSMLPPQGPPTPATQPHPCASGRASQVAPDGQEPPQVPAASAPQGRMHRSAGPPQQRCAPSALKQMHTWAHLPSSHRSAVQASPSSQSASVAHTGVGVGSGTHRHAPVASA